MLVNDIIAVLEKVRVQVPLVHSITNYVTVNDCANVILAAGASPIMADDKKEAAEITGIARSLVINIGTLNERTIESMILSGKKANERNIPVVFDPVGAGASAFRNETAKKILKQVKISVIRGNLSEVSFLAGMNVQTKGVDSSLEAENTDAVYVAKKAAKQYQCMVCITGVEDIVTDGNRTVKVKNGHKMMTKVTGTGCMTSAITGAMHAVTEDSFLAALSAVVFMGIAGERAFLTCGEQGVGSFHIELINACGNMTAKHIEEMAKIEEL